MPAKIGNSAIDAHFARAAQFAKDRAKQALSGATAVAKDIGEGARQLADQGQAAMGAVRRGVSRIKQAVKP